MALLGLSEGAPLILSVPSYEDLAGRLARETGYEPGAVERRRFADGETYQRLVTDVRGRDVVLVAGTTGEEETLLAYDLACAVARYGALRLTWVLPYFGYQTMERAVCAGEVVTARTRAALISAVPTTPLGNRVVLLDLHAAGIPFYFGDAVQSFHLYGKRLVFESARALGGDDFVLAAPDAGRAKWVQSLGDELGVDVAFAYKRRLPGGDVRLSGVDAPVRGRRVVIYDDMIRTGGTLLMAARAFRDAGAVSVHAVTTHLVLPGDSLAELQRSGLLDGIAGTDSHPRGRALEGPGLTVRSVAPLYAEWLAGSGAGLPAGRP